MAVLFPSTGSMWAGPGPQVATSSVAGPAMSAAASPGAVLIDASIWGCGRQRQRSSRYGRGDHDGGGGLSKEEEPVEDLFEFADRRCVDFEEEAVLSGDSMTLDHL